MIDNRLARITATLMLVAATGCGDADGGEGTGDAPVMPGPSAGDGGTGGTTGGTMDVPVGGTMGAPAGGTTGGTMDAPTSTAGSGGIGGSGAAGQAGSAGSQADVPDAGPATEDSSVPTLTGNFSFFVTSIEAMRELSGSQDGFGGDLGGLEGADRICQQTAAKEGAGHKTWRAFLSTRAGGPGGGPIHAIDRIGDGPWYDRNQRLVAMDTAGLLSGNRPAGDAAIIDNLPNERGEPLNQNNADDHDVLTGSDNRGRLFNTTNPNATCNDWTTTETMPNPGGGIGIFPSNGPMLGHSWPARSGQNWIQAHPAAGCSAGVHLEQTGPAAPGDTCVGCAGGYGAIYCFALTP
jgi:hypothetical protein